MASSTSSPSGVSSATAVMDSFFRVSERGSTVSQEIRGGVATFLTMSYILLVNPQVLTKIGIPAQDAVIATALSSGAGCLVAGVFG